MPRLAAIAVLAALAAPTLGVWTTAASAEDRYGPPTADLATTESGASGAPAPLLTWPGKSMPSTVSTPPDAAPVSEPAIEPAPPPSRSLPVSIYSPPPPPPAQKFASLGPVNAGAIRLRGESNPAPLSTPRAPAPTPMPALSTSATPKPIAPKPAALAKAAPPSATAAKPKPSGVTTPVTPPPTVMASAAPAAPVAHAALPPRRYSLHSEFGLTPDPIPLPKQFFADSATADLAAPPPPLDPHPVPGTQAATSPANTAANRARESALETADTQSDGPVGGAAAF
jgi:hypothetical protein